MSEKVGQVEEAPREPRPCFTCEGKGYFFAEGHMMNCPMPACMVKSAKAYAETLTAAAAERSRILEVIRQLKGEYLAQKSRTVKASQHNALKHLVAALDELLERLGK